MPAKTISSAEAAQRLGVTVGRVQALLRQRRILGTRLVGRVWLIPFNFTVTPGARGPKLRKRRRAERT